MSSQWLGYTAVLLFAIAVMVLVNTYVAVKVKINRLAWSYLIVQMTLLLWLVVKLLELVAPTAGIGQVYHITQLLAAWMVPLAWLGMFLNVLNLPALTLPSNSKNGYRRLLTILALFGIVSFVAAVFVKLHPEGWLGYGIPVFLTFFLSGVAIWMWRSILGDLSFVSLDLFMNTIDDLVLIFDRQGILVDFNRPVLLENMPIAQLRSLDEFIELMLERMVDGEPDLLRSIPALTAGSLLQEISIQGEIAPEYFMLNSSLLLNKKEEKLGFVITFHKITVEKNLTAALDVKNAKLEEINAKLRDYLDIAHRLEDEKERVLIAHEIHDTLGHHIMELLTMLEVLHCEMNTANGTDAHHLLNQAIESCRGVLKEIRVSVAKLVPGNKPGLQEDTK